MEQEKVLNQLRTFFKISTQSFEMIRTIVEATGSRYNMSNMHLLHRLCLGELEKQTPDMSVVENLIKQMEEEANKMKRLK